MSANEMQIKTKLEKRDPRTLKLLDVNARFMKKEQYDVLVANIERDGALTSVPLVWVDPDTGVEEVLSGNHRTMASIDAGLETIDVMVIDQPLTQQQRVAIQLSHNAITGEDDPSTLRILYDSLDDVDMRLYSGLDDKTLDMLEENNVAPMSEANLEYQSVMLVFLPEELEHAKNAFDNAKKASAGADMMMAGMEQYMRTLDALETAHSAANVTNVAAALSIIIDVFEENLESMQDYWRTEDYEPSKSKHGAPMETVFGSRLVTSKDAATINKAIDHARRLGDMPDGGTPWDFITQLASEYLNKTEDED